MKRDVKRKIFEKDSVTLVKEIGALRDEIAHDKLTFSTSKPKDVNVISKKRKKLAILNTALTQAKLVAVTK